MHRLKYHPFNGLYRFSIELGTAMSNLPQDDMRLHFYVPEKDFGIYGNNVSYIKHRSIDKFYKFGTGRFDVWHATTTLSWYKPFSRKSRFVFTIHDLNFLEEKERSEKHKAKYLKLIQQRVDRADYLTYISEYSRQEALKYLKINNKPGSVIYNGCNAPVKTEFTKPLYIPAKPFLFSIGLFMSRKNFHVLPALLKNNNYELIIAGLNDMSYKNEIVEAGKSFNVAGRVHLVGAITEEEKFWYYKNCEAFLFPSLGEGFGLPVIEAMQFGKPVFLSTSTCLPEIGGDAAYYFDSFDPMRMQQVFDEGMQHYHSQQPSEKIKKRAAFFNWEKAAEQYLNVYRQLD